MKIGLDCRFWGLEHAGLGRYTINLITNLADIDHTNSYYLLLRDKYFQQDLKLPDNFVPVRAEIPCHSFAEQIKLPGIISKVEVDLMHYLFFIVPILANKKFVVTIHDLIKHRHSGGEATTLPKPIYYLKYAAYRFDMWWAAIKSAHIIVPTQYVKNELTKYYKLDPDKVTVTLEGANEAVFTVSTTPQRVLDKYKIRQSYLIYVGNIYPYKNIPCILQAIKSLPEPLNLVIVCARSVFWQKLKQLVQKLNLDHRVTLAGFVPDKDLGTLYQKSLSFVTASLDEGFGITALEAMAAGTPAIVADTACFPETCADAALYFDPHNPKDLVEKVRLLQSNPELRQELIKKGKTNLERFSWRKMAGETRKVYENMLR